MAGMGVWVALVAFFTAAMAAPPLRTEAELRALSEQALQVLPWHQYVLFTMARLDRSHRFAELSLFSSPSRFALPSGQIEDGSLMRMGVGMGLGVGQPTSGAALFGGAQLDYALVQTPPLLSSDGTLGGAAQGVMYGGLAVRGWMLTGGALITQPLSLEGGETPSASPRAFVTLYQPQGAALSGLLSPEGAGLDRLSALRGTLMPEQWMERLDLRALGLPLLGVERYASGTNPYGDPEPLDEPLLSLPLGMEDIASLGLRAQVVPEIRPDLGLRRALAGYVLQHPQIVTGAQVGVARIGGDLVPSAQAYAVFHPEWFKYFSAWGVPRISIAYSYNIPDPIAFFSVQDSHVFGIQYVYGPPEFGRPLIPLYRREVNEEL